ncbi:MAG: GAF domain-containing protein [Anaerolineae bacterium]
MSTPPMPSEPFFRLREELAALRCLWAQARSGGDSVLATRLLLSIRKMEEALAGLEQNLQALVEGRAQMEALVDIARAINSSLALDTVLNEVMDQIVRLTGAERAMLMLLNPETGDLEFRAARHMDRETITDDAFRISRSIVYRVAREGQPILTTDALMDPRFHERESVIRYNLRSILCVPLRLRGQITGVIYADNRIQTGLFSERERDLLAAFADQAAVAIENARLFEQVRAAKNLMDSVLASVASGVITINPEGKITLLNRSAERILGRPAGETLGLAWREAFPLLRPVLEPMVDRIQKGRRPLLVEEADVEFPDRGLTHLRWVASPLQEPMGSGGVVLVVEDLTEQRRLEAQERFIRETFQRYVSPAVVQRLLEDSASMRLGGQRQEVTVLFADLRGFTSFSERCGPEELVEVLNRYLAIGAEAVLAEEGTLDKFIGDAVMAIFNAPLPQPDHSLRAIRAALRIRDAARAHHPSIPATWRLEYGIGIAVGEAVVGNVGTPQQLNYTAIGACVNLAKRLEEMAAPGQILLSRELYQQVRDDVDARPLAPLSIAGFQEPVEVYELLALRKPPGDVYGSHDRF